MLKQCFPSDKSRKEVSKIEYRNVARKKEIRSKLQIGKTQPLRINGQPELLTEYIKIIGEQWFEFNTIKISFDEKIVLPSSNRR